MGYLSKSKTFGIFTCRRLRYTLRANLRPLIALLLLRGFHTPGDHLLFRRVSKRDKENRHNSISCPEPNFKVLFFGIPSKFHAVYCVSIYHLRLLLTRCYFLLLYKCILFMVGFDVWIGISIYTWLHSILVRHNSISCSESAHVVYGRFLYSF